MSLTKRLRAIEKEVAKKNSETGYNFVIYADGESESEAQKRTGLADWPGVIIFLSETDLKI